MELLRYAKYIQDDKVKSQYFLSGLPQAYKDRIEFDEPRTLEEEIRKAKYCYDQTKANLISIRHGRTRRMRSLTKGRKVSNTLTSEMSKDGHHILVLGKQCRTINSCVVTSPPRELVREMGAPHLDSPVMK